MFPENALKLMRSRYSAYALSLAEYIIATAKVPPKSKKDILEFKLYKLVCDGTISLDEARREISSNWIETYKRYVK